MGGRPIARNTQSLVTLENSRIRLVFNGENGSLLQIEDRKTGRKHLQDPRGSRLAKLVVPTPGHISRPLYSHEAGRPDIQRQGDELVLVFPELKDHGQCTGIFLTVRVRLPADSAEAFFSAEIRNEGPNRVLELWFPWIGGRSGKPGRQQDTITTSQMAEKDIYGRVFDSARSPHAFGHHQHRVAFAYLLPMMDMSSTGGGLSYNQYEKRPSPHTLVFENPLVSRDAICLTWAWSTYVFAEPGQGWHSCEYGIGVHQGDWHESADRFRHWLAGWHKPCDTSKEVREKIGLFHIQAHGFSGERYNEFRDMPEVARDAMRYGIRDLLVWDCAASVYYRPDRGDFWETSDERQGEIRQSLAEVRTLGCTVSTYVNWLLLAERNVSWERLRPLVQKSLFDVDQSGYPCGTMDGALMGDTGYEMGTHTVCCGADGFRPYADEVLERTFRMGFDAIAIDMAAEWKYCLSTRHGHASPWEAWDRTYAWYGDVRRATLERYPHSYTIGELPDLYNIQHIDLLWTWGWRYRNIVNVSVFRYLFPRLIPCWCMDENQRDVIAEAFAYGSFFAVATRDMTGRLSDAPAIAKQVARLSDLRRKTAPFVSHGLFRDNKGLRVIGGIGFAYESEAGLAVALANPAPRRKTLQVELDLSAYGGFVPIECQLFRESGEPNSMQPGRQGETWTFPVELPAFQAGILTLRGPAGQWTIV